MKTILTVTSLLLLTACGGGGSSAPSAPAPVASAVSSDTTTAQLNVPDGFDYRTQASTNLDLTLSSLPVGEHYLSLYSRYQALSDGSLQPERGSKLLSARVQGGRLNTNLVLPSAAETLLLEIWTRGETEPMRKLIRTDTEGLQSGVVIF